MRSVVIAFAFAGAIVGAASSCFVDRRSSGFECSDDEDCADLDDSRVCDTDTGFCVQQQCPSDCNAGCDLKAKTCRVTCPGPGCNGNSIDCPEGFDCTITCGSSNACNEVDCSLAARCTITCNGTNACDYVDCNGIGDPACNITCTGTNACSDIDCDDGACQIGCIGTNACGDISCADSCNCTASCPSQSSCGIVSCPTGCEQGFGCGGCNTCGN